MSYEQMTLFGSPDLIVEKTQKEAQPKKRRLTHLERVELNITTVSLKTTPKKIFVITGKRFKPGMRPENEYTAVEKNGTEIISFVQSKVQRWYNLKDTWG